MTAIPLLPRERREHLFGDLRGFAQCHAPTLVGLPDGGVLVAFFAGTRESHRDVAIWAARREPVTGADSPSTPQPPGSGWSEPRVIAKIGPEPHWNPVLFSLGDDELVLHFKVGQTIRTWRTFAQRSHDGGRHWEPAEPLVPGDRGGRGAVKNKPIRLLDGTWLAGASLERRRAWDVFVDRSRDGIRDWKRGPLLAVDRRRIGGKGVIQPTLWQSTPDDVHMLLRSTGGEICRSDSADGGRSWSRVRPIGVPNNNSGLDLARLEDGRLALACNPVEGNWAERTPLSILFSEDNGESWPDRIDVERGPGEFSYPALVSEGGSLSLAYTWNRRRIAFARL